MTHLRIVPPPGASPPPKRRRGPSPSLSLRDEEVRHLRAAIRGLVKTRYGTVKAMASALGVHPAILTRQKRPSGDLAVALWRLTGVPVEVLLRGQLAIVEAP